MKKVVMAITYEPKICPVRRGDCRQTIRPGDRVSVGDSILFHGWSGLPYRTPWDWRLRVDVTEVIPILMDYEQGIGIEHGDDIGFEWHPWSGIYTASLAELDYIAPPNGFELRDVLEGLNKELIRVPGQIIRW